MILVLGGRSDITNETFSTIRGQEESVYFQGMHFEKLTDMEVSEPCSIVISNMAANQKFYETAFKVMKDDVGIIYGDYLLRQNGAYIHRLNSSYVMNVPCIPLFGSIISPSYFYQIISSIEKTQGCDVSTKIDPSLDFFGDCCPQHWPEVAFSI